LELGSGINIRTEAAVAKSIGKPPAKVKERSN
jgi:hypothetical protein